ncbi:hypothetical protein GCM10007301_02230 [Azorhizobium oxalatiphilum]|uniref:Uncharacterized protein n=1 Tax=Azorhizobium oxalatiphilum TaxID=980631 RepID=A0A917F3D7_9HYPH|nr:hypothetical protein [Azorhizobium oxalatiphilum]GGF46267.1 hypothetical protein GCM10007301_02230 [Azorhizobium oxalatiphilum]
MKRRTWLGLALAAAVLAGAGVYQALPSDPATGTARPIRLRLGETVGTFMTANELKEGPGGPRAYTIAVDRHRDDSTLFFTDVWVAVRFEDVAASFDLPPGRILMVGQSAGVVADFDTTLYDQPLPFPEADRRALALTDQLLKAGWQAETLFRPGDEMDSNSTNNRKVYATLTSVSGNRLQLSLTDLSRSPRFDPNLPGSAPVTPSDPTPRFLLRVAVYAPDALRDRLSELAAARRFALRGNGTDTPGLRLWMDAPDWTPEAAGMRQVDVPNPQWAPDRPASGRQTFRRWQMPDGTTEPTIRW